MEMNEKENSLINNIESKEIEGFFPETRTYTILEIIDQDEIFIHGGCNKKKDFTQINVFDAENMKWRSFAEISTVDPFLIFDKCLSGHTSNLIKKGKQKKIVVYGGFDGKSYSNAIYMIETDNYQFTQLDIRGGKVTEYPLARCYHTSNYDQESESLFIFGGWNGNISALYNQNFHSLWKFDFKLLTWNKIILQNTLTKSTSSLSLRGHSSHFYRNKIIVYGGVSGFNKYNDNFYEISPKVFFNF